MLAMGGDEVFQVSMSFFRLRLGLFERDLVKHLNISVSIVCRICQTWIHFIYLCFKDLPLWPTWDFVNCTCLSVFRSSTLPPGSL